MRKRKSGKYIGMVFVFMVICTVAFWALSAGNVLGKFVPEEPYVTGEPESASVFVTSEGKTQKGGDGSGAEPCSSEVPTAEGKKGSETNPFVLLEIVPEKAMQQFTYLCGDVESGMPEELDAMKLGIEACKSTGKSFIAEDQNDRFDFHNNKFFENNFGRWFKDNQYSVYKIGSKTEKEEIPFAELAKLYSYKITDKDLRDADVDVDEFRKDFEENKKEIGKLIDKYPGFFVKNGGPALRDIAKEDSRNWDVNYEKKVVDEGEFTSYTHKTGGYLVAVEPGKGDFGFASEEDCKNWIFTKTGTAADRWKYVEKVEDLPEGAKANIDQWNFWSDTVAYGSNNRLYEYNEKSDITGIYMDFTTIYDNNFEVKYYTRPIETEERYTIDYYGLKTNEILKRALFTFKDEEDFDNFHMKVICMTPAELNELAKKDTDETLDMIERADMYSFQTIGPEGQMVNDTQFFYELYHKRILGNEDYKFDKDKVVRFYENDLEWDLITKILMRESENQNLPLVFNQMVGKMAEAGVTQDTNVKETHMYVTEGIEGQPETHRVDVHETGNLNNITKLYLISIQFDLLAKKDKTGMERTFTEDILPYIMKISLGDKKPEGAVKNTATTTGYYTRQLCTCPDDKWSQAEKERSYYLWNRYTFFPAGMKVNLYNCRDEKEKEKYIRQGYLPTYFVTNANPFMDGGTESHQGGSDGNDEKNVTIICDDPNSNTNHSSLLANKGDNGGLASKVFETLFQIINGQSEDVENLTVSVLKQKRLYEKLSDDSVLIDYSSEAKYKSDKTLYLKLEVSNMNNEAGIIKEINFLNDSGKKITLDMKEVMDENANPVKKENVYTSQGTNPIYGYRVPENGKLTFFIPYSLHDWQSGYKTVELITRARMYFEKKKRFITGKEIPHEISIGERTLFNLE